jgi:hypothetical protein
MILSLDISSSCVGYSVFNNENELIEMNYVKFNSKLSKFERLQEFINHTKHLVGMPIKHIAIEEPLKKFQGKFSSADTIAILNFFNGLISSYLYTTFGVEPIYYNVRTVRATAFPGFKVEDKESSNSTKHEVWKRVMELEPQINWKYGLKSRKLLEENYDMADSYAVGRAHIILIEKQTAAK